MIRKTSLFFSKILIAFSIVLICSGTYLIILSQKVPKPTIKDSSVETVHITTKSGESPFIFEKPSALEKAIQEQEPVTPVTPTEPSGDVEIPQETPVQPLPEPVTPPVETFNPTPPIVVTPSQTEINQSMRNNIVDTYGVQVQYGSETEGYSVGGLSTTAISDEHLIYSSLGGLFNNLGLYPKGFFREMSNNGYNLTILLVQRFSVPKVTGVTDHSTKNVVITIAIDFPLDDTLHHELFHYIDAYMIKKGASYYTWNSFNPPDFTWGSYNASYSYDTTLNPDSYFVNDYAQTDEYEDRASIFEYMMMPSKASCLNQGKTIWLKARTMNQQMHYFYHSVSDDVIEYWERFL